jgi:hypothetical protein
MAERGAPSLLFLSVLFCLNNYPISLHFYILFLKPCFFLLQLV